MNPFVNDRSKAAAAAALLVLGAALSILLAGPARGQALTPNYRDTDLRQVVEAVGAVTGRNFLVDPRVRAQVSLFSNTPMSPEDFYEAFLATLSVHGFVAIESGEITRIVPDANARQLPGPTEATAADDIITQVVRLDNVAAPQVVPVLRPLQPQYAHLAALQASNMLVIVDRAANVDRLMNIINRMDRAGQEDIEVIRLENAFAGEVVQTLMTLNQAAQAAGGAPMVQAIADERTNSVLLSGSDTGRMRFRGLIAYLDEPSQTGGDSRVRYLNYADAEDLATKLQAQFSGIAPQPGEGAPPAAGGGQGDGTVTIWADQATNALVINAPARVMQDMMAVIDQIDIPRAQVAVDAIIVELSEEKAAELGVTWVTTGDDDDVAGLTNFSNTTGGVIDLATAASGDTPSPAAIAQGLTLGVGRISDVGTSWAAILSALRGDGTTNIIATPHIIALDNEEAEITVGQEVPFLTGQFTNTGAAGGAVNPFQTIQREEVGTRLRIVPQINEGSGVKLTIEQEQSSISPGAGGAVDLITNNRTITTSVFVEDGDVLVLGGLMDDQLRQSEQRVPGLGRIPGLGWLFRARSTERVKTNLMVFIRPMILRDSAQARFRTNEKYNYIRELQRQQAEEPVRLMREETPPQLPELEVPPAAAPGRTEEAEQDERAEDTAADGEDDGNDDTD
ncbi:MAG: type II secretion system secretin GspD [Gammaproteobacteria bacterium]|nr:type II secretion system secretin GspD [Gammaproteobacteria bacterium]